VFVQDYHFALLPRMLKEARPDLVVAHFWHIPWPGGELFRVCPWAEELIDGLLGNDLLAFHTQADCNNFLYTVERTIESIVDKEDFSVHRGDRCTTVRPIPISVDFDALTDEARSPATAVRAAGFRRQLGLEDQLIGVGVDRVDYTKGIPERLTAVGRFFEKYPEYRGRFTFLQIGPASRVEIDEYRDLNEEVAGLADEINARFGGDGWRPIRVMKANYAPAELLAFYTMADVCVVSSLHDGMNLVAKEFVSARPDGGAALVLSRFTGAARELSTAMQINPYDAEGFADALCRALEMPCEEKAHRMERMREAVAENTIYDWAANVVLEIGRRAP
jgi:trehalose 6-phosphate synthase